MKNLLTIFSLFLSTQLWANDFCLPKMDYPSSLECSGQVFTATSMAQLQEYLETYGDDGSGAKDLVVDFTLRNQIPEIHGPCKITLASETNAASVCLDARSDLVIGDGAKLRSWGGVTLQSQTGQSSFGQNSEIQTSDIKITSYGPIFIASNVSWRGWNSLGIASQQGGLSASSTMALESNSIGLNVAQDIDFGSDANIRGHHNVNIESQGLILFATNNQIQSNNLRISADEGVRLQGGANLRGHQTIELLSSLGDWQQLDAELTTNNLTANIAGAFVLQGPSRLTAHQSLNALTNTYLLGATSFIQSNNVSFNATTTAAVEALTINAWQSIVLDAASCTLSPDAFINSNQKTGRCFEPDLNIPPVAVATVTPESGYAPLNINLDASGSSDSDGSITDYMWLLPNGQTLNGMQVTATLTGSGIQSIGLRVTDDGGAVSETSVQVELLVDAEAPQLATNLEEGTEFISNYPAVQFDYSDELSGVDTTSFQVLVNNINVAANLTITGTGATLQFSSQYPLADGNYNLVASVADLAGNTITIERNFSVITGLATDFGIIGKVLNRLGEPIVGATISFNNGPLKERPKSVVTDENGFFRIVIETTGRYVVNISAPGFVGQAMIVEPFAGVDYDMGEIKLLNSDPVSVAFIAETGGTLENSLGSKLEIPGGVLTSDVTLSFTDYVDTVSFPGPLPELSQFTYAFDFSEHVQDLNGTVEVSLYDPIVDENGDVGFPLGTELVFGQFDPELGLWFDSGINFIVREDGNPAKDGSGGPNGNVPILFAGDVNQPSVQPDSFYPDPDEDTHDHNEGPPDGASCPGCRINMESGNLAVDHVLPNVKVFGEDFPLEFSYNSQSAFPTLEVFKAFNGNNAIGRLVGGGHKILAPGFKKSILTSTNTSARAIRATLEGKNSEGQYLRTGVYPVIIESTYTFLGVFATAAFFGAPANSVIIRPGKHGGGTAGATFPVREPVDFSIFENEYVTFINEKKSAFGSGWTLNGLSRLHFNPSSTYIMLTDGRGGAFKYNGFSGNPPTSFAKKFKELENKKFSNEIRVSAQNGMVYIADCSMNQVYQVDSLGNSSVLAGTGGRGFSGDGNLAINAELDCPTSVSRSVKGDYFIADSGNLRIRKIDKNGIITTLGGNGDIAIGEDGTLATETGIGRPVDVMVDELLVVYYTTTDSDIMMIDPRGKVRRFSSVNSGYVPYDFDGVASLQASLKKRVLTLDVGKRQIVEVRPNNSTVHVEIDLGDDQSFEKNGMIPPARLKQFVFDKLNNRYFILDDDGRLFVASKVMGPQQVNEYSVAGSSVRLSKNLKDNSRVERIESISYAPETGLIAVTERGVKRFEKVSEKDAVGEIVDEYYSQPNDPSTLALLDNGQFERSFKDGSKEYFNRDGLIVARTNTRGHSTFYRYNESQQLVQIELANTKKYEFSYDGRGYLTAVIDPVGRQTLFNVDSNGQLVSITNPDGTQKQYVYNEDDLLTSEIKENGVTEGFVYNAGKIIRNLLPGGRAVDIQPSDLFGPATNPILNVLQMQRAAYTTAYFPSRSGECLLELQFSLYLTGQKDCLGRLTRFSNTTADKTSLVLSPENRQVISSYEEKDLLVSRIDGNGLTTFEYENEFKKVSKITDAYNNFATFAYAANGELATTTDKRNLTTSFSYNEVNLLSSITDSLGHMQTFSYDGNMELASIADELGHLTVFGRDLAGNITSVTDADNRTTLTEYDLMNRPVLVTDALGGQTSFGYEASGLLTELTDSLGRSTAYTYNAFNLVAIETRPDNTFLSYQYDNDERLTLTTQEDGSTIEYIYNLVGELLAIETSDDLVEFEYDLDGLLTKASNTISQVLMSYDEHARPKTEAQSGFANGVWNYSYNLRGDLTRSQFQILGNPYATLDYTPNPNGDIEAIVANVNGQVITWQRSYDQRNLPIQDTYNNGITINYEFDPARRLTLLENRFPNNKIISSFGFTYSNAGDITAIEEKLGGDGSLEPGHRVLNFGYDALHRLIQSDLDELDFNYDLLGNPSGTGYVTNVLNLLLESPSYVYQYDLRGNLIQQTSKLTGKVMDFIWSVDNKLMQVEIKNNGTDVSGRMGFGYDALGRRIAKTWQDLVAPANSYSKTFIYDREDLVMELQNEKVTAFYVHAPGIDNPIAILRDMNNNNEFDDDEVFFYTKDHLGSIRELVGLDGKLKQRQRYTAYGVTTREKNTDQLDRLIDHAYGFTGRELDSEIGLYFYRARYYSPEMNRFVSEDPIEFAGEDVNLHRYVDSNPLRLIDPFGLKSYSSDVGASEVSSGNPMAQRFGLGEQGVEQSYPILTTLSIVKITQFTKVVAPIIMSVKIQGPGGGGRIVGSTIEISGKRRPFLRLDNGPIDKTRQNILHYHTTINPHIHRPIQPFILPPLDDRRTMCK